MLSGVSGRKGEIAFLGNTGNDVKECDNARPVRIGERKMKSPEGNHAGLGQTKNGL